MKNIIYLLVVISSLTSCTDDCKLGEYDKTGNGFHLFPKDKLKLADKIDTIYLRPNYEIYSVEYYCGMDYDMAYFELLKNLKDSTNNLYQIPNYWTIIDNSILYTNCGFVKSHSRSGAVVSLKSKGNRTEYEYPAPIITDSIRNDLNSRAAGLYQLKDSAWIKIADSQSKKAFWQYCRNGVFFVPSPGFPYDKKVILDEIDTWPW